MKEFKECQSIYQGVIKFAISIVNPDKFNEVKIFEETDTFANISHNNISLFSKTTLYVCTS